MKVGVGTVTTALLVGSLVGWIAAASGDDGSVRLEQVAPVSTPQASATTTAPEATVVPQAVVTSVAPPQTTSSPVQAPVVPEPEKETTVTQQDQQEPAEQPAAGQSGSQQWTDVETVAPDTVTAKGYGVPAPTLPPVPAAPPPPAYQP